MYVVLDAARPSFLDPASAAMYLGDDQSIQCTTGDKMLPQGCWLLNPKYVGQLLNKAGVEIIYSSQIED